MQKLNVYGDSHARFFRPVPEVGSFKRKHFADFEVDVQVFIGATVLGLPRRESTLSVSRKISDTIDDSVAVMNFGQVDVELGYYYRRVVKGEDVSFEQFSQRLCEAYSTFLEGVRGRAKMIIVKGVNPPVLVPQKKAVRYIARIISEKEDGSRHEGQYELLSEILPPIAKRMAMSKQFNELIQQLCRDCGFRYFDLWDLLINKRTNQVRERFIPAGKNHHLVDSIWVRRQHWRALAAQVAGRRKRK